MSHVYITKRIKNVSGATVTWVGVELANNEYHTIPRAEWEDWCHDDDVVAAIAAGDAYMNDGTTDITNATEADEYIKSRVTHWVQGVEVDPTDQADGKFLQYNSTSGKLEYDNNALIIPIVLTDEGLGTAHTHTTFLTRQEAWDLAQGVVSSVVKSSGATSTGTAHTHTVTVTWDSTNHTFQASSSTDLFHNHVDIVAGAQGVVGQNFEHSESLSESTTSSGTYQTKLSHTTGSLPFGDYLFEFYFGIGNSNGKEFEAQFRYESSEKAHILTQTDHNAGSGEYLYQSGAYIAEGISGAKTVDIRYRAPDDTVRIGDARIYVYRIK